MADTRTLEQKQADWEAYWQVSEGKLFTVQVQNQQRTPLPFDPIEAEPPSFDDVAAFFLDREL